jgi:hypothetical protein
LRWGAGEDAGILLLYRETEKLARVFDRNISFFQHPGKNGDCRDTGGEVFCVFSLFVIAFLPGICYTDSDKRIKRDGRRGNLCPD